jgi:ribosomal protein S18 acetylase RimI-like enzyme
MLKTKLGGYNIIQQIFFMKKSKATDMKFHFKFYEKDELTKGEIKQIKKIWKKSFKKKEEDDMELLDTTIVGTVLDENKKIVAISFLLCPTEDLLQNSINSLIKSYTNIKEQGVTKNDCYIYNFCVSKSKRKKGYGNALLIKCHEYIKVLNKHKILLFVEHGNIPAICLYNKYEYKVYRATPSGFIMEKNLD